LEGTFNLEIIMGGNYSRRRFISTSAIIGSGLAISPMIIKAGKGSVTGNPIRLGAPLSGDFTDPVEWVKAIKSLRYSAAYCPVQTGATAEEIKAFRTEAKKNNILIPEVGAWSNMIDPDDSARKAAILKNIASLQLADEIGANCCVNISGARGDQWDGPYAENYSKATFDLIIETVRYVIDQVKPVNTFYTLEPMPYMIPDSPDSYLEIIKAIDRKQFAVHLDPVNMISSPRKYFKNAAFLKECFSKLGPYIKSIHAKDISITPKYTVHLQECRPGAGYLDYTVFLQEASKLKDIPLMLEHLEKQEEYKSAADYIREVGAKAGISFLE
jgi:sugar phosphate isomerase/epimerase